MSFDDTRVMSHGADVHDADDMRMAMTRVAGFIDNPIADVKITPAASTASPRTINIQVRDRLNEAWKGRWWVRLAFGASEWAVGGGQTITVTSAGASVVIVVDQVYDILTNADGTIALQLAAAAGTRYFTASVIGRAQSTVGGVAIT